MSWSDRTPKQKEAYRKYSASKIDEHYKDRKNHEEREFVREEEERNIEDSLMFAGNIQDQVQIEQTADDDPNDVPTKCRGIEHIEEAVSGCCGSDEHPDVSGMCGGCNEFTGWECPECGDEMNEVVYGIHDIPYEIDIHNKDI